VWIDRTKQLRVELDSVQVSRGKWNLQMVNVNTLLNPERLLNIEWAHDSYNQRNRNRIKDN
jgi:hypothetical protein